MAAPDRRADAIALGRRRQVDPTRLRPGLSEADPGIEARGHQELRACSADRTDGRMGRQDRRIRGGGRQMKFFAFHLMPYAALDPDYDKKHNSAWVTLPNTYYDPKIGHQLYNRYLDELEFADAMGFDGVCVNEHHQNAYGLMPIPGVMAGALARRTAKGKIAVLGRALPLLNNPLVVAAEFAMLDNITAGRLVAGFVRGIGAGYHSSGVNPAESHA